MFQILNEYFKNKVVAVASRRSNIVNPVVIRLLFPVFQSNFIIGHDFAI